MRGRAGRIFTHRKARHAGVLSDPGLHPRPDDPLTQHPRGLRHADAARRLRGAGPAGERWGKIRKLLENLRLLSVFPASFLRLYARIPCRSLTICPNPLPEAPFADRPCGVDRRTCGVRELRSGPAAPISSKKSGRSL